MHRYFVKAIAAAAAASLFAFPAYAKTEAQTQVSEETVVSCPVDIVSATIQNVTQEIRRAEADEKAAKKAAKKAAREKKEQEAQAQAAADQTIPVETQAQAVSYEETASQTYVDNNSQQSTYSDAAEAETYAQETQSYVQETSSAAETAAAQEVSEQEEETVSSSQTYAASSSTYSGEKLNAVNGMVNGPSGTETYYNLNMSGVISNMQSMGIEGEYWVRDDGVKMYGDYVMAAANLDTHPYGSIVESSLGDAIVVDTGDFAESDANQLDIAVEW